MVRTALRIALCTLVGLLAGRVLGPLFVPDPTSASARLLAAAVATIGAVTVYRAGWLGEAGRVE